MVAKPIYATGRRKTSQARVFAFPSSAGDGSLVVNDAVLDKYFHGAHLDEVLKPLKITEREGHYTIKATVKGGGISGQAGALRLGIARLLEKAEPELRASLKSEGLLTRDAREVERKKPGRHKARKSTQFSKR